MIAKEYYVKIGTVVKHRSFTPRYKVVCMNCGHKGVFGYEKTVIIQPLDYKTNYNFISIGIDEFLKNYCIVHTENGKDKD